MILLAAANTVLIMSNAGYVGETRALASSEYVLSLAVAARGMRLTTAAKNSQ
jgi:hypothetical protein